MNNFFSPQTPVGASLANLATALYATESPNRQAEREASIQLKQQDAALKKAKLAEYEAKERAASEARAERAMAPLRIATGVTGGEPQGQRALDYIKAGPTQDPLVPNDDNGVANIQDPRVRPEGVTPEHLSEILSMMKITGMSNALPGKTNYEQAMKGAREAQGNTARATIMGDATDPTKVSQAYFATSGKAPYHDNQGRVLNLVNGILGESGQQATANVGKTNSETRENDAQAGNYRAHAGLYGAQGAKVRSETLPQIMVPSPNGGASIPVLGKDMSRVTAASVNAPTTGLTDAAIEAAAHRYALDGTLPPNLGRGAQGEATKVKILNRAADVSAERGDSASEQRIAQIANKASAGALLQLTKQEQMVGAFERNALANADIALQTSDAADRTGVPVLNRWLLAGRKNILGDPDVSRFHAATTTFVNEYAKIMSGSMGNTVVSDSLRKETEALLSTKDTPEQFKATVDLMKQEMRNRMKGFADQKSELTRGMAPQGATAPGMSFATEAEAAAAEAAGTLKKGTRIKIGGQSGVWN